LFKKSLKNGTVYRFILSTISDPSKISNLVLDDLRKNPNFKVIFHSNKIKTIVAITDRSEILMSSKFTENIHESPALYSNNPSLVDLAANYFEEMWTKLSAK
jgi:hypothetical protein